MSASGAVERPGDVAHARRAEALGAPSSGWIRLHSFSSAGVSRTAWPGSRTQAPSSATVVRARERLQHRDEGRRRKARLELQPQPLAARCRQDRDCAVEGLERREQRAPEPQPDGRRQAERRAGDADHGIARRHRVDVGCGERAVARKRRKIDMPRRAIEQRRERGLRVLDRVRVELREALGRAALARRSAQVEEAAARDGALRRGVAQHEAVMRRRRDRPLQHELDQRLPRRARSARRRAAPRAPRCRSRRDAAAPASIA